MDVDANKLIIEALPFVLDGKANNPGRKFWHVRPTGDAQMDFALGDALGRQALNCLRKTEFSPLLGWVVGGMVSCGHFGPVEISFMDVIARAAIRGRGQ
ncbi:MAG TPA: hypothetical protein VK196_10860 [Magnetospirillum sp.]|nr:hypothetical protein [Magnetospirillum sp.]